MHRPQPAQNAPPPARHPLNPTSVQRFRSTSRIHRHPGRSKPFMRQPLQSGFLPLIVSRRFSVILDVMWTRCGRENRPRVRWVVRHCLDAHGRQDDNDAPRCVPGRWQLHGPRSSAVSVVQVSLAGLRSQPMFVDPCESVIARSTAIERPRLSNCQASSSSDPMLNRVGGRPSQHSSPLKSDR